MATENKQVALIERRIIETEEELIDGARGSVAILRIDFHPQVQGTVAVYPRDTASITPMVSAMLCTQAVDKFL